MLQFARQHYSVSCFFGQTAEISLQNPCCVRSNFTRANPYSLLERISQSSLHYSWDLERHFNSVCQDQGANYSHTNIFLYIIDPTSFRSLLSATVIALPPLQPTGKHYSRPARARILSPLHFVFLCLSISPILLHYLSVVAYFIPRLTYSSSRKM